MMLRMLLKDWSSWIRRNQDNAWHVALVQEMSVILILMVTRRLMSTIAHLCFLNEWISEQTETWIAGCNSCFSWLGPSQGWKSYRNKDAVFLVAVLRDAACSGAGTHTSIPLWMVGDVERHLERRAKGDGTLECRLQPSEWRFWVASGASLPICLIHRSEPCRATPV